MTTFRVTVRNKLTNQPVQGALVFLIPGAPLPGSPRRTTRDSGVVDFYDGPQILNVKTFDVVVLAAGYYPDAFAVEGFGMTNLDLLAAIEPVEAAVKQPWEA